MMMKTRVFGPGSSRARRGRVGHPSAPRDSSARARTSVASSSVSVMAKGLGVPSARGALPGGASVARSPEVSWSLVHYREQSERLGTPRNPRRSFDNDAPLLLSVCRSRRARSGCVPRALSALPALCLARAGHRRGAWSARLRGRALRHPRKSLLLDSTSARRERSPSCSTSTRTPSPGVEAMRTTSFPTPRVRTRRSRIPRRGWTASAIP